MKHQSSPFAKRKMSFQQTTHTTLISNRLQNTSTTIRIKILIDFLRIKNIPKKSHERHEGISHRWKDALGNDTLK
ncbi:hypothetical protein HMPREF3226_02574 [Prevotella corporis]|uniref:Uncharacterized protein n=1 Tax=Prevotella corporis TaxID=28128 RepID=A0A133PV12_9BACT|nr:hypothetical protein HMPREF3226_02574 [Prevotella corporis]